MTPGAAQYGEVVASCPLAAVKEPKTWIPIQLIGEDDKPVPGGAYRIILTDGSTVEGVLDRDGNARVGGDWLKMGEGIPALNPLISLVRMGVFLIRGNDGVR